MTSFFESLKRLAERERPSRADLEDVGLSRMDHDILVSGRPGARERLLAMAARFGLSEADVDRHRGVALEAAEKCALCDKAGACQRAIDAGGALPEGACPNAALYRMLAGR